MNCAVCGWENHDDVRFCAHCGKPIEQKGGLLKNAMIVITVAVIAVIAVVAILITSSHSVPASMAHVDLKVVAPEYTKDDSPISLVIEGKSSSGDTVGETVWVTADGGGDIELPAGLYNVSLVASPLCETGRLYAPKETTTALEITEEDCRLGGRIACPDIALEILPDDEMTPELIERAYAAALDYGFDIDKANAYRKSAQARCESACRGDDSAAADELHVTMEDGYEFDLPEYWRGKVSLERFVNRYDLPAVGVRAKGVSADDTYLVVIGEYPAERPQLGGDYFTPTQYATSDDGRRVVSVGGRNWPVIACEYATTGGASLSGVFCSAADLEVLVDLATGGGLTYEQAVQVEDSTSLTMDQIDYFKQICDSVVFSEDVEEPAEKEVVFQNPSTLDVSGDQDNEYATLYGVLERVNMKPADTHSALGGPVYFLKFDNPVTLTYNGYGVETAEYVAIQVAANFTSTAEDERTANHPEEVVSPYDDYVGKRVAVTGRILDGGSAYYVNGAAFFESEITEIDK